MSDSKAPRRATIMELPSAQTGWCWRIRDETGFLHTLRGTGAPARGEVGDTGTVIYRTGHGWGLWFWESPALTLGGDA